ncbi:unnamed protein product [Symbiodinium sp. KB8]|nr:unnamed protein product [Symbiodinium sp. KB8]
MANLMFNLLGFGFACCFRMARWPVARHVSFGAFTEASRQLGFLPERSHQQLSSDLSAADPVLQAFAASASRILVLPQGRNTGGAHTELTSMILFGGGARLAGPASTYFGLGQFQLGSFEMFASVEASLQNALPCGERGWQPWLELILCGHSYGVTVARSVALQLCTCGLDVRGLVAIDPRCLDFASLELLTAESLTSVPRSLAQSLSHPFYRLDALELEFVAPLGPHKALRARVFVHLARGLAASWAYQLSKRSAYHLLDADHFSVGGVQAWDMSNRIKRHLRRCRRRCRRVSAESGQCAPPMQSSVEKDSRK